MPTLDRLGKYELVRHLASGGMARVFLARVSGVGGFERHLVLKTVRPERSEDATFVSMFLDEARLVATLHHQHIAQVYEVGVADDGTYFLAMEYLHGETVRGVLERARDRKLRLPLDFALTVVGAAASGLHHAHERRGPDGRRLGIVHRDVTPSNIIAGYDGSVKLIDFGIAKALERSTQTKTGFIKGKAGYMAPEQALGEPVDRRADVFSLGVVLYELTTQVRAFPAANELEVAHRIVRGDVKLPSVVVPGFPPVLEDVIMTALERDPDDRFPDTDLMARALNAAGDLLGVTQRPVAVSQVLAQLFGKKPEPWLTGLPQPAEDPPEITQDTASLLQKRPARIGRPTGPMFALGEPIARAATEPAGFARAATEPSGASRPPLPGVPAPITPETTATSTGSDDDEDDDWMPTVRYLSLEADEIVPEPPPPRQLAVGTTPPPPPPHAVAAPPAVIVSPPPVSDAAPHLPLLQPLTPRPARMPTGTTPAVPAVASPMAAAVPVPLPAPQGKPSRAKDDAWTEPTFQVFEIRARHRRLALPILVGAGAAVLVGAIAIKLIRSGGGDDGPAATPEEAPAQAAAPAPRPAAPPTPTPPPAPATVKLQIQTEPPGATVLLDGKRLGHAPITVEVPREAREVVLKARKQGHVPRRINVSLARDATFTLTLPRD